MTAPGKRIAVFLTLTVALTAPFWMLHARTIGSGPANEQMR